MNQSKYKIEEIEEEIEPVYIPNTGKYRFGTGDNGLCKFNDGVSCDPKEKDNKKCYNCGWNPVVSSRRLPKILEELSKRWRYVILRD